MKENFSESAVIAPKQAAAFLNRSYQTGARELRKIRMKHGKEPRAYITIPEFAEHMNCSEEYVRRFLRERRML